MHVDCEFDWDEEKNAINKMKHGVSFENARKVFKDPKRIDMFDWEHSYTENRWKVIGIADWVLLSVSYTERDGQIRIISARKTTQNEKENYYGDSTGEGIYF